MNMKYANAIIFSILLAGLAACCGCPVTQSQNTPHAQKLCKSPTGEDYYIYVPTGYDPQKPTPLVITLHGTPPWDVALFQINEWKALAEEKNFIVVAPKLSSPQGILPVAKDERKKEVLADDAEIIALRDSLCREYNIDPKMILLTGFSAGGYAMFYTGLHHQDKFSILIARACNNDEITLDGLDAEYNEKNKSRPRIPVLFFVGKDDLQPIQDQTWMTYRWLRRHGWTHKNCTHKETKGGHIRRPLTTWEMWQNYLKKYGK